MPKVKGKILFNPLYEGSIILKKLLKDMGYEYSSVEKELSKKLLNEYDALIIQEDRKLSHDEIRDITKFVIENNGGLFVGTETCYNNIGELTKIFGIQMGDTHSDFLEVYTDYLKDRMDLVKYGEKNYKTELIVNREHPLTKGIEEVYSPYDF
ncbi:MAG: hypothetical protein QMD12_03435, partial [Candidatus Aenigmarchaeota archaeon]|nr:hypothetical protein [Candidatus Aenigmarchaeota archaeon]